MVLGLAVVIVFTFPFPTAFGTFDVGIIGLGVNIVAVALGALIERLLGAAPAQRTEDAVTA
jgi:hypothetical protein